MTVKFHIRKDGNPGVCMAEPGDCPLGENQEHYSSIPEARSAYENSNDFKIIPKVEAPSDKFKRLGNIARREIEKYLPDWKFEWDQTAKRFGSCDYRIKTIKISSLMMKVNDDVKFHDTLYHEIAHGLVGGRHGHDSTWEMKAKELGSMGNAKADRKYSKDVVAKWSFHCPKCDWAGGKHDRKPSGAYTCPRCYREQGIRSPLDFVQNFS